MKRKQDNSKALTRRTFVAAAGAVTAAGAMRSFPAVSQTPDKVTIGTSWKAQAEHGGYYQALATGLYKKHGLDVTIRMGGPQVRYSQLPPKYGKAATRWLGRLALESDDLSLHDLQLAAAALHALPRRPDSALQVLRDVSR